MRGIPQRPSSFFKLRWLQNGNGGIQTFTQDYPKIIVQHA
jgi:hypothetical protein